MVKSGSPRRRFLFPSLIVYLLLLVGTVGVSAAMVGITAGLVATDRRSNFHKTAQ